MKYFNLETLRYYISSSSFFFCLLSGGSGRSGILCLLSAAVLDINCGRGIIDVLSTIIRMCIQRKYIIYDKEQLRFCYEAVLYHTRDLLLKRKFSLPFTELHFWCTKFCYFIFLFEGGILTNQSSFESKQASSTPSRHVRHPSEDFILGSGSLSTIQSKLGMEVPVTPAKSNETQATNIDFVACDDSNNLESNAVPHTEKQNEASLNKDLIPEVNWKFLIIFIK